MTDNEGCHASHDVGELTELSGHAGKSVLRHGFASGFRYDGRSSRNFFYRILLGFYLYVELTYLRIVVFAELCHSAVRSDNNLLCLRKLGLRRSDLCLETLDKLLGMLGLTRRFCFCLLDRQFQAGDLLCQDISVG